MIKVLSIHIPSSCSLNCPFCYTKNVKVYKSLSWFLGIPKVASDIGVEQCPVGGGTLSMKELRFLSKFSSICREHGIIPNLTSNGVDVPLLARSSNILENLGCISISFDKYKARKIGIDQYSRNILLLKKSINNILNPERRPQLGMNYLLLDKESLWMLPSVISYFIKAVDVFYVLHLKNYTVDYTPSDIKEVLYPLAFLLKEKLCVDDSIQLSIGKKSVCHAGNDFLSINASGELSTCSFSKPLTVLNKPDDIKDVLESCYPFPSVSRCEYVSYDV